MRIDRGDVLTAAVSTAGGAGVTLLVAFLAQQAAVTGPAAPRTPLPAPAPSPLRTGPPAGPRIRVPATAAPALSPAPTQPPRQLVADAIPPAPGRPHSSPAAAHTSPSSPAAASRRPRPGCTVTITIPLTGRACVRLTIHLEDSP